MMMPDECNLGGPRQRGGGDSLRDGPARQPGNARDRRHAAVRDQPAVTREGGCGRELAVVIATRNRRASLLVTLERLAALPERPPVVVVDNASTDGTVHAVRREFPATEVLSLTENRGAAARTVGVRHVRTRYVAFSDDDSWWAPGMLTHAPEILAASPGVGLPAAGVLGGPEEREAPACAQGADSPLRVRRALPGPPVLGFIACGAVAR